MLFVGDALAGNDAVDQLTQFNRIIEEYQTSKQPRGIDGIFLTKVNRCVPKSQMFTVM